MSQAIENNGSCQCGGVKWHVEGDVLMNGYCHCKGCARNRGVSPVHFIAIEPAEGFEITEAIDNDEYKTINN